MNPANKPELYLHAIVNAVAIICLTVLAGLGSVDGQTAVAAIAGLGGISGIVTGLSTVKSTSGPAA